MLHVHNPRKIKRKHGGIVVSEPEKKEYKVVFKKRRHMDDWLLSKWLWLIYYDQGNVQLFCLGYD